MKVIETELSISITLNVLIVEDDVDQAFNLKSAVECYKSIFQDKPNLKGYKIEVAYRAFINGEEDCKKEDFNGTAAFSNSCKVIEAGLLFFDIVLCDFNLGGAMGTELLKRVFEKEVHSGTRSYKILHSVQTEYQKYQKEHYVDFVWDAKTTKAIHDVTLREFEEKILMPILFGNPVAYNLFYKTFNNNSFKLLSNEQLHQQAKNISVYNILYIYAIGGGNNRFKYLTETFEVEEDGYNGPIKEFTGNEFFIPISDALYVNKLWYADSKIIANQIKFITPGNNLHILDIGAIQKKKKHKSGLIKYIANLLSNKKQNEMPTFTLADYFRL